MEAAIFHVLNRGVDKRDIFLDDKDRLRFIHDLFEFNDEAPAGKYFFHKKQHNNQYSELRSPNIVGRIKERRECLVHIYAFCLMTNHYHLMLRPIVPDGIIKFMKKLNVGYAMYFNEKYERTGTLFQGRYKRIPLTQESHFIHLPYYIHLNPLDYATPEWRDRRLTDYKKALNYLKTYRWSSHLDYLGNKNFPSVTQREFLLDFFGGIKGYEMSIRSWIKNISFNEIDGCLLE